MYDISSLQINRLYQVEVSAEKVNRHFSSYLNNSQTSAATGDILLQKHTCVKLHRNILSQLMKETERFKVNDMKSCFCFKTIN